MDSQIYQKIIAKKEFSKLPKKDVEKAYEKFDAVDFLDEEKIKFTRDLLKKVFGAFSGRRLFSKKLKEFSWILKHHISTKERFPYYEEIYERLLRNFKGVVIDLGCGVNGFSYEYFPTKIKYIGVEAVGQFVDLTNNYFRREGILGGVYHLSLFDLKEIKELIKKQKGEKIIFLFKVLDSLEMLEKDYSKKLLEEIIPLTGKVVVSFATRSLIKNKKFHANKKWLIDFIEDNFRILNKFEFGNEKYVIFSKQ